MSTDAVVQESARAGQERARALVERRRVAAAREAALGPPRYLVAEGDSWFDYPFFQDILEALEDHHFRIRSCAHHGDTAESMAYEDNQLDRTRRVFEELAQDNASGERTPKAILLSCGGNDVAGIFGVLLNHRRSTPALPVLNEAIVQGVLEVRVKAAISALVSSVTAFSDAYFPASQVPVIIHGYGFPVPDGRGFPILGLSGPWLKPGFAAKGYVTTDPQGVQELEANAAVMAALIKRFNDVLRAIAAHFGGRVRHVDLTDVFSNVVAGGAYLEDWRDEMHATKKAYKAAAQRIAAAI